jgi:hypothetical protein
LKASKTKKLLCHPETNGQESVIKTGSPIPAHLDEDGKTKKEHLEPSRKRVLGAKP